MLRRAAATVATVLVIAGTPLVAQAITDEQESALSTPPAAAAAPSWEPRLAQRPVLADLDPIPELGVALDAGTDAVVDPAAATVAAPLAVRAVHPVLEVLAARYSWAEQAPRVAVLQENLGLAPDGRYGVATQQAHRRAAEFVGLPTDTVPLPGLPPGTEPGEWEALRQCESNGNYAITNRTGTYRGAYQFDRPTWNSVAERHAPHLVGVDPAAAAPSDQDAMAYALYSERGAQPWPHCGRYLR
jgi:peptidoglycan hydrolase-like protein with peptidoglycan-binding domain